MIDSHHGWNKSYKPLYLGYVVSMILMVATYRLIVYLHLVGHALTYTVFGSAIASAIFQLIFFLHLGLEEKPNWTLLTFLFLVLVIILIIGLTLWIMDNLNYNVMPKM